MTQRECIGRFLTCIGMNMLALIFAMEAFVVQSAVSAPVTAHDFIFENIEGGSLPLAQYAGRPVLLVNTASMCGFTPQYEALQQVWEQYRDRGLVVLGVPSDNFGRQEYGSSAEIRQFCEINYGIDFPMTEKMKVKGTGRTSLLPVGEITGRVEGTSLEFPQICNRCRRQSC